jgi:N-acetyl-anhydromuramyl-L-alanine amidase AmpD
MSSLDTSKIKQYPLSTSQYYQEEVTKKQIVLHHTAGSSSALNVMINWNSDDRGRIATCVAVSGKGISNSYDGEIVQGFPSKNWAYHLGVKQEVFAANGVAYQNLDKLSIGIEICNWGPLEKINGKFYNYVDKEVPKEAVCELATAYKGHKFYHLYSDAQIESVRQLLVYWNKAYGIDITYKEAEMWNVSKKALSGIPGLYTHNSYRKDKTDISPQPKIIEMLKSLKNG